MNVRVRLVLCFGGMTALLITPTLIATSGLGHLRGLAVEGRAGQASAVASLGRMQAGIAELDRLERSFLATYDSHLGRLARERADSLAHDYHRFRESLYGRLGQPLGVVVERICSMTGEVAEHVRERRVEEATVALAGMISLFDQAERHFAVIADSVDAIALRDLREAETTSAGARVQTLAGLGIALALTLLLTGLTTHTLTSPLRRLSRATARVADGSFELPDNLPYGRKDEIGELSSSFGAMVRRLADLDRTKAQFLGVVSHELKTPLNVIRAYAELLGEEWGNRASTSQKRLIADVAEQANVMARRVSRLMDISRLETGAYRLALEATPTEDLATGLRRTFEGIAENQEIDFVVRVADSAPVVAVLDVDIVRDEILGNLIVNAFRFSPRGGTVEVLMEGDGHGIVFTVTDSGPGIPEEQRAHVFSKHYVESRARALGSGLGLAIAKEMVELHGGLISLEASPPGVGARFRVALPLAPEGATVELPKPAVHASAAEDPSGR